MPITLCMRSLKKRVRSFITTIPHYLHLQLFLSLVAWPILLMWGLPLSAASIIGNFLFAPLLTIFLTLSSLIFFLELLSLPSQPLIFILELVSRCWYELLSLSDRSWLWLFPKPPIIIALLIPLSALAILHYKKSFSPLRSSLALFLLFICAALSLKTQFINQSPERTITCFEGELIIRYSQGMTTLIDTTGCMGRRISAPSYITCTLIPALIQQGITKIDHLIVAKVSTTIFRALTALVSGIVVDQIYLPAWQSRSPKNKLFSLWETLLRTAALSGTKIHVIHEQCEIVIGTEQLKFQPHAKPTVSNGFRFITFSINA